MKKLILIISLAISVNPFAQDADKTVTLVVSGQGKTQDEAKQVALRSAIEQAFGAFISSKTEIINDNLVKDEIVSVSNGNIQMFEIVSEVKLPDGSYITTLKATVSVSKLTLFCKSKGLEIEINGALFTANVIQKELNKENEKKALINLVNFVNDYSSEIVNYSIESFEPRKVTNGINYILPFRISYKSNNNYNDFIELIYKTIKSLSMSDEEVSDYLKMNLKVHQIDFYKNKSKLTGDFFYERKLDSDYGYGKKINRTEFEHSVLGIKNEE